MTHKLILYIGDRAAGLALAETVEAQGGYVYLPHTMMEALGMYVMYMPQVVVIDTRVVQWAQVALEHLRSVDARPIILLTEDHVYSTELFPMYSQASPAELSRFIDQVASFVPHRMAM